ncbi:MAG: hypothetical protein MJK14_16415 [Rivularia sp. ALOHA_DT_140]|nr:hypothetical protein [Rivularia sp. ALOHA_DT_140]
MVGNQYSRLFRFIFRLIKYFFLVLIGLSIAFVIAAEVGNLGIAVQLFPLVFTIIKHLGLLLLCLIGITIIIESLQ